MHDEPYITIGIDPANPSTHVLIVVRGVSYSVHQGQEQHAANEIAASLST